MRKEQPSLDEFYALIEQAHETAKKIGLTQQDIDREVKNMRAEKQKTFVSGGNPLLCDEK